MLKAAALATRQGQPDVKVSGVTLRFGEQEVAVQTADGVANIYRIGFDKPEAGGELSFGLYIDENTDANVRRGYARFTAGFHDWRGIACAGVTGATALD